MIKQTYRTDFVLLLLTVDVLKIPSVEGIITKSLSLGRRVVAIHDQENCLFPGPSETPQSIADVFYDKAITYMRQVMMLCTHCDSDSLSDCLHPTNILCISFKLN